MVRSGSRIIGIVAILAITITGCKTKYRSTSESNTRTEATRVVVQDSIAKRTATRIEVHRDTLAHVETVTEYAPPVVLNGKVYTPVRKTTVTRTDTGRSEEISNTDTQDISTQATEQADEQTRTVTEQEGTKETDDKSGGYIVWGLLGIITLLGVLSLLYYFLWKKNLF